MKKYIIRFGGLAPKFHGNNNNLTFHPSEAKTFDTPEAAHAECISVYGSKQASIRDQETSSFVKWVNY